MQARPRKTAGSKHKTPYSGFGQKIQHQRIRLGLTQIQLAASIGITEKYMSLIECGQRFPSWAVLAQLSQTLDFDIDYSAIVKRRKS